MPPTKLSKEYAFGLVGSIINLPFKINPEKNNILRDNSQSNTPWRLFNVGNNNPINLLDYIKLIEKIVSKSAVIQLKPMQVGDVHSTFADTKKLAEAINFAPSTDLSDGLSVLVDWVRKYYKYH